MDLAKGMIWNKTKGEKYQAMPLQEFVRNIIEHGGLIEYTKTMLGRTHDI